MPANVFAAAPPRPARPSWPWQSARRSRGGCAPLCASALEAITEVARGYANLEYDLAVGERGSRHVHLRSALRDLTGAEDCLVANNNAAAVLLVLSTLAVGREVIVSRGQ